MLYPNCLRSPQRHHHRRRDRDQPAADGRERVSEAWLRAEAHSPGQGRHPRYINIMHSQCCGTVTIYYGSGSGSGSDF